MPDWFPVQPFLAAGNSQPATPIMIVAELDETAGLGLFGARDRVAQPLEEAKPEVLMSEQPDRSRQRTDRDADVIPDQVVVRSGAASRQWAAYPAGEMIGVAGLVLGAAVMAGGLRVESRSPDALCPDARQVSEGAQRRIGEIEGSGEWLAALTLVHRPDAGAADVVRLELTDPAGRMRMRRELPRAGTSCTAVGQALVLLLDAYFRNPADEERPRPVAPAPVATVAASPAPPPAAVPARSAPSLTVGLVGGWAAGPSSAAVGVGVGVGLARWVVGAEGAWMPERQEPVAVTSGETGTVALRAATLRIYMMRRWALGPRVDLLAGPEVMLGLDRIATEGVPGGTSNVRGVGGPGLRGQLRFQLASAVALSLIAAADYAPRGWAGRVAFDDAQRELFPPEPLRLFLGAEVGFVVAP